VVIPETFRAQWVSRKDVPLAIKGFHLLAGLNVGIAAISLVISAFKSE